MKRELQKISVWLRRKSRLPVVIVCATVVLLLFFNEDTSLTRNMEYQHRISELKEEIRLCKDSARYYREKREAIEKGDAALEQVAREQYRMQRPTEDVYVIVK